MEVCRMCKSPRYKTSEGVGPRGPQDSQLPLHSPLPRPLLMLTAHERETQRPVTKLHPSVSWFKKV